MTNNISGISTPSGDWQLLAEFEPKPINGNVNYVADKVSKIIRELKIPALQLGKILGDLMEIVENASFLRDPEIGFSQFYLRIWVSSEKASRRGWGYFIVQKPPIDSEDPPGKTRHSVELFLYQERYS